jgi:hypothetical protein
MQKAVLATSI